jgi:hypothetical protein
MKVAWHEVPGNNPPQRSVPEGRYDGGLAGGTALRLSHTVIVEAFLNAASYYTTLVFLVVIIGIWIKFVPDGEHFLVSKHPLRL